MRVLLISDYSLQHTSGGAQRSNSIIMDEGRRSFLKKAAAAPVAGAVAASAVSTELAGVGATGLGIGSDGRVPGNMCGGQQSFTSFAKWFSAGGDREIRENAKNVYSLDPDLAESRLPLQHRFRVQKKRNYERIMAERKSWFSRLLLRNGSVTSYF